ncbi:MAG: ribonuclease P protein component [Pseudomonadota bacterium]
MKKRSEFLLMRGAKRYNSVSFTLQARHRKANEISSQASRFGFTVTRKTGNAVQRNRIKRRLRDALRHVATEHAQQEHDYVIVAKVAALTRPFGDLKRELTRGLGTIGLPHRNKTATLGENSERHAAEAPGTRAGKRT